MIKMAYVLFLISAVTIQLNAQVKAELIYPVVPIADTCRYVFDDTFTNRVISKNKFLQLDKLYSAYNFCFDEQTDTIFFSEFSVTFVNLLGEGNVFFTVYDGRLQNEYQSSLVSAIKNIKSYTKVVFTDIHHEKDGAKYQVAPFSLTIDSLVIPQKDTCWRLFPAEPGFGVQIEKDKLIQWLSDSFGYNTCTKRQEWVDTSSPVTILPTREQRINGQDYHIYSSKSFNLTSSSSISELIDTIESFQIGDRVDYRTRVYIKNGEYHYAEWYIFQIMEEVPCYSTFDFRKDSLDKLQQLINKVRKQENYSPICFADLDTITAYSFTFIEPQKPPYMISTPKERMSYSVWKAIRNLEVGDQILLSTKTGLSSTRMVENQIKIDIE